MSARFGIPSRTLRDICQQYKVPSEGGYDPLEVATAIVAYFKGRLDTFDVEAAKDRARKSKAEANTAELDNAEQAGDIKRRLEAVVKTYAVEVRKAVVGANRIPLEDRQWLTKELSEIKVAVPPPAKG